VGRNINRHYYTLAEIDQTVKLPVVQKLIELIEFRNSHLAFSGDFELIPTDDNKLHIKRTFGEQTAELIADLKTKKFEIKARTTEIQ
jgi:hypothetical protein